MAGVKGRSGRKKVTINSENGKARLDALVPQAVSVIEEAVNNGDATLARWVLEMRLGKAAQQLDTNISGSLSISADEIARAGEVASKAQSERLANVGG